MQELVSDIEEKIRMNIATQRQKIIGFSASEASVNLFSILLHKKNLITPGFNVNHNFFSSSQRSLAYFPQEFQNKEEIMELLVRQEEYRVLLCYGKDKSGDTVNKAIKNFYKLKEIIDMTIGEPHE